MEIVWIGRQSDEEKPDTVGARIIGGRVFDSGAEISPYLLRPLRTYEQAALDKLQRLEACKVTSITSSRQASNKQGAKQVGHRLKVQNLG